MRIDIKTKSPVKDNDIKALYLIRKALEISSPHMIDANVKFSIESFTTRRKEYGRKKQDKLWRIKWSV
jgi:hypothetical protein